MAGDDVTGFVAQDSGQLVVVLDHLEQAGVDADLIARNDKRVRLIVLKQDIFPGSIAHACGVDDAGADLLDAAVEHRILGNFCCLELFLPGLQGALLQGRVVDQDELLPTKGSVGFAACQASARAHQRRDDQRSYPEPIH